MYKLFDKDGVKYTIDPLDHFDQQPKALFEACGYLPMWLMSYRFEKVAPTLQEHMDKEYGFGLYEMNGGTVNQNLTHSYPEDPDLYPMLHVIFSTGEEFIQWQSAICAMRQSPDEAWFITRMD